jgi:predicted transcriptional regulator YheO
VKTFKVHLEDDIFVGTGQEIMEFVKTKSFFDKSDLTLQEWVKEVQSNTFRLYGIGTNVDYNLPIEAQCEQLVEQLIKKGLIREVK